MSYKVVTLDNFRKETRRLIRKHPSLQKELFELGKELIESPELGTSLGSNGYKIRLPITSKGKGKSGMHV
jgi:hypothetical protein